MIPISRSLDVSNCSARVILATDIFGQTDATDNLREALNGSVDVICPYAGERHQFQNEAQAYEFFSRHSSVNDYAASIQAKLQSTTTPVVMIGFSVGASAMWLCSRNHELTTYIRQFIGFYGNQIRHHLNIKPAVPTTLFLPKEEPHFCVQSLAEALNPKALVTLKNTTHLHGFMNSCSTAYDATAYANHVQYLNQHLLA